MPGSPLVMELCGSPLSFVGYGITAEELAYCASSIRALRDAGTPDGRIVAVIMELVGRAATRDAPEACLESHAAMYRRMLVILLDILPPARGEGAE